MNEKLAQALNHVGDEKIAQAATARKFRKRILFRAVAAAAALALLLNMPFIPGVVSAKALARNPGSQALEHPDRDDYEDFADFELVRDAWWAARDKQAADTAQALSNLNGFFLDTSHDYLAGTEENRVWSPINAYIALAMLAEVTDGESRQQILSALNTRDLETLRTQVGAIWEEVYRDDGNEISVLANSLWLSDRLGYDPQTIENVARYHYADIYQTDFSSRKATKALQTWLNNHTGGLLKKHTATAAFPPEAVLTLASTVYLQSKWVDEFNPAKNTVDVFHAPGGDREVTYMNRKNIQTNYYWGESFGAISLWLKNGCKMWLILPDADKTLEDVLAEGEYLSILPPAMEEEPENAKYMKVNLTMPKFDIASSANLKEMLQSLGITDIFDLGKSDFTAITGETPVYVTSVNQAARIIVDEQGVKAASYIEIPGAGAAMPPEEIIDFILDRPFLFVLADTSGIPLFTGVVNNPDG